MTIEIDSSRMRAQLNALKDALGTDASTLVADETKRVSRLIASFVPPLRKGGMDDEATGKGAVERDIKGLATTATEPTLVTVSSKWGIHDVDGWLERKDKTPLNLQWTDLDMDGTQIAALHRAALNSEGRIPVRRYAPGVWGARVATTAAVRADFIQQKQARSGRLKACCGYAASKLGGRFKQYISRHFGNISDIAAVDFSRLKDAVKPVAVFYLRAPGITRFAPAVRQAFNKRGKAIGRRVQMILDNYGKQSKTGKRIESAKAIIATEPEEVLNL